MNAGSTVIHVYIEKKIDVYIRLCVVLEKLWNRKCMCHGTESDNKQYKNTALHSHGTEECVNQFKTAINEDRKEIVYCEKCYQAEFI